MSWQLEMELSWEYLCPPKGGPGFCVWGSGTMCYAAGTWWGERKVTTWVFLSTLWQSERGMVKGKSDGRGNGVGMCGVLGSSVWGRLLQVVALTSWGSPWVEPFSSWPAPGRPLLSEGCSPAETNKNQETICLQLWLVYIIQSTPQVLKIKKILCWCHMGYNVFFLFLFLRKPAFNIF